MKKIYFLIIMVANLTPVSALRIEYGNNIVITQPVNENLYIAGGNVTINAPIHGDLMVAGGTIVINDTVSNDILLAGGRAFLNGFAGGDIRCAGGEIRISKNVMGDVVVAGGQVNIDKGVTIRNLLAAGGNITLDGNVNGEVKGAFGELLINGNILKDVDCRGGKITINGRIDGRSVLAASEIIIGNDAVFENDIRYWNRKGKLDFKPNIKNGSAIYDPSLRIRNGQWYYLGAATILGLLWYLGMAFLMILIIEYLFANTLKKAGDTVFNKSLRSLGFGFLFIIGLPVAAVVLFITLIGMPVGVLLVFFYILLLLHSSVITSVVAANWMNNRNNYHWNIWHIVFAAFGIFILLKLLTSAPFVGWLAMFLLTCISFGAILLNVNWKSYKSRPTGEVYAD
jgi:cytoskeletal protein CcmA (bactofilin family)